MYFKNLVNIMMYQNVLTCKIRKYNDDSVYNNDDDDGVYNNDHDDGDDDDDNDDH